MFQKEDQLGDVLCVSYSVMDNKLWYMKSVV